MQAISGKIEYRPIGQGEIELCAPMVRKYFWEFHPEDPEALRVCLAQLAGGCHTVFGAWDGDILIGIVGYSVIKSIAMLQYIWIYPEYRGGSIGGRLYREAEKTLPASVKDIHIFVAPSKESTYTKIGFRKKWAIMTREVRHGRTGAH